MSTNNFPSRSRKWDPILLAALRGTSSAVTELFKQAHDGEGPCGLVPKLAWSISAKLGVPTGQQLQFVENVSQEVALQLFTPRRVGFDPQRASAVTLLWKIIWRCAVSERQKLKVVGRRRPVAAKSRAAEENAKVACFSLLEGGREVTERQARDDIRLLSIKHDASVICDGAPSLVASYYDEHYTRGLSQREASVELNQPRSTLMRAVAAYEEAVRRAHVA